MAFALGARQFAACSKRWFVRKRLIWLAFGVSQAEGQVDTLDAHCDFLSAIAGCFCNGPAYGVE